jgi:hypothetical protein
MGSIPEHTGITLVLGQERAKPAVAEPYSKDPRVSRQFFVFQLRLVGEFL